MTWQQILGLSVVAALVTTTGTLLGLFLKEVFFVRSFERWKATRSLEDVSRRYREPIALTALELCNRLSHICEDYPPDFLESSLLAVDDERFTLNSAADPYYRRYKLISTVYRLCAFLGWIELYRQDTAFLDPGDGQAERPVDRAIFAVRSDLADGQLNTARDWNDWHDMLLFREEQRAVGESMIISGDGARNVMGYAQFCGVFPATGDQRSQSRWIRTAAAFFVDPKDGKDFRRLRMQRLIVHLVDLVELLAPSRLRDEHRVSRSKYAKSVAATTAFYDAPAVKPSDGD